MDKLSVIISAIVTFFVLYSPQPLLPLFAKQYEVSISASGALMTATLIPLALAPLFYGYLLSKISPVRLLKSSLLIMSLSCILFALSENYQLSLAIRFLQGLCIPAAITSITTCIASQSKDNELQANMSIFVTGTILGGLLGRVLSGVIATVWVWQGFYYCLAIALVFVVISLRGVSHKFSGFSYEKLRILDVAAVFVSNGIAKLYGAIFCLFYCFVAFLNYLPFMVEKLEGQSSEMLQGLMYSGFVMGVITSLNAKRIVAMFGCIKKVILGAFLIFFFGVTLLFVQNTVVLFFVLFILCGANFLAHSVISAEVNRRSSHNKSIVNALYVMFYYSGGVLGSFLPGVVYQYYGYVAFLINLLVACALGLLILLSVRN